MSDSSGSASRRRSGDFWSCSDVDIAQFWEDGFLIVPELFRPDEAELLHRVSKAEEHGQPDENGVQPIMWLFSTRDAADKEDIFNAVVHSRRMVDTMMRLLGDEVYVYHYKMAMKTKDNPMSDLETNGQDTGRNNEWVWHQDYVRCTVFPLCVISLLRLIVRSGFTGVLVQLWRAVSGLCVMFCGCGRVHTGEWLPPGHQGQPQAGALEP